MKILDFNLLGIPKAKQSTRFSTFKVGDKTISHTFQPPDIVKDHHNLRGQIIEQLPKDFVPFSKEIYIMKLEFIFPYLKTFSKKKIKEIEDGTYSGYKTSKPDLDNLEKMLWDAMNGVVFSDDSLICIKMQISKKYGRIPGIKLRIIGK